MTTLQIDDAGWGFPLSGVMVGVGDGKRCEYALCHVNHFRMGDFQRKTYLQRIADVGMRVAIIKFGARPGTHTLHVCRGFCLDKLVEEAQKAGFTAWRIKVEGLLQDELEGEFARHVREFTGRADLYYDPKEMKKESIPKAYRRALQWGMLPDNRKWLKTGWGSIQEKLRK